jgi:HEAT repeat protein
MKKLSLFALMSLLVPAVAGAQAKPVPPAPPAPPVPASPAPVPSPAPMIMPRVVIPELADAFVLDTEAIREHALEASRQAMENMHFQQTLSSQDIKQLTENARRQAEEMRMNQDEIRRMADNARRDMELARPMIWNGDFAFGQTMSTGFGQAFSNDTERSFYERGQSALSQKMYEQAITRFEQAIAANGTRKDGALYWKAFAQFKLGKSNDANATLSELQKMKESKYLSDAKALEAEIKRTAGQATRPENEDDEDLKLLALQGLVNSDPERAIPLVQGVLASAGSLRLKERALFVLAQSNSPQAHTILVNTAKNGTPDLQLKAINYLGLNRGREGSKTSSAELMEIYNGSQNDDVKAAILRAFGSSGDRQALVNVISNGTLSTTLRGQAVNQLGNAQGQAELWSIYQKESNKELKLQILSALGNNGAYDRIIEVAKSEKDADIRNRAIRSLGNMRAERSGAALIEIYPTLTDVAAKKAVIQGLANQNNAEGIITLARKETTWELKKSMVEKLTNMPKNKAAQDYLMEIIK